MKDYLIGLLIIGLLTGGKMYEDRERDTLKAEVIKEKEQQREVEHLEIGFFWDEFNNQYIIDINGNAYTFTDLDLTYINEYEDLEELKPGIKEIVEEGENFKELKEEGGNYERN